MYDYISETPGSSDVSFMSRYADLAQAPIYKETDSFWEFENSEKLQNTYLFYEEEAKKFPLNEGDIYDNLDLVDIVYGVESPVVRLEVKKVFASGKLSLTYITVGHKPCLLEMTFEDPDIEPKRVVFKDDDLRPDLMVENLFEVFNFLWDLSGLPINPKLITFKVIPGGKY